MQTDAEHCWPTTPDIVGCYMLCALVHPAACFCLLLGVVVFHHQPTPTWTQQLPTLLVSVCLKITCNIYPIGAR